MARIEMLFIGNLNPGEISFQRFSNLDEITFGSWHKFEFDSAIKDFACVKPF